MTRWELQRNRFEPRRGPVLVVVLDGVGCGRRDDGDAVYCARTPALERIWAEHPTTRLRAHGSAVGLPSEGDMGNSEVGHNAIGAGRVFDQGAKLVENAIRDGSLFEGEVWTGMIAQCRERGAAMHFIGLLSDGNVHSHIDHLLAMIRRCDEAGVERVRVHALLDGRDVAPQSAERYVERLEALLDQINRGERRDYAIASGGGRMLVTMDRYEADWSIVERGWKAHVLGEGRRFASARAAIDGYRAEKPEVNDQFLGEFVVERDGAPVGTIDDGDCVVLFNFRGDRAMELTRAFEDDDFSAFKRQRRPRVRFAGMMQYDGDLKIPARFLVEPPTIDHTLGELLARNAIPQFACSETQKFGHVTYFWNGNRTGKFAEQLEEYVEVPSDAVPFEQRPWMKAAEITDATIAALRSGEYRMMRINYPNGDMVGHTGDFEAAVLSVQTVDLALGRLLSAVRESGGIALVTADHGNADQMYEVDKKSGDYRRDREGRRVLRTSHSLNPVPFTIYDPGFEGEYELDPEVERPGLSNIAATVLWLLGFEPPDDYDRALIRGCTG